LKANTSSDEDKSAPTQSRQDQRTLTGQDQRTSPLIDVALVLAQIELATL
jgi:hypothetical protein